MLNLFYSQVPPVSLKYEEIKCKRVLANYGIIDTQFWTNYCFDPYVNCEINCIYCHTSAHKCNLSRDFYSCIYAKTNAPQVLAKELESFKRKGVVRLSGNTDPYQPAEEKYRITRQILEVLENHNWPFAIGTKSDLILRDLDLISNAAQESRCCVSLTITTLDEKLARMLEPNAPSPKRRLDTVKRLSDNGINVGVWLVPLIPYITDSNENMSRIVESAVENGAKFILTGMLDMRGAIRFKKFLEENFAQFLPYYETLYEGRAMKPACGDIDETYLYTTYRRFISLCQKHKMLRYIPHFYTRKQALLFYIRNFSRFNGTPIFELTQLLNLMFPTKEFLQNIRVRFGNSKIGQTFLETFGYFPH
jgi:DNA repair photolyase